MGFFRIRGPKLARVNASRPNPSVQQNEDPATSRPQRLARISHSSASTAGARPQASQSATLAPGNGGGGGGLARETNGNQEKPRETKPNPGMSAVANKLSLTTPASFTSKGHCNVLHIKLSETALIKCSQLSESAVGLRTESQAGRAQTTKKLYKLQEQNPAQR